GEGLLLVVDGQREKVDPGPRHGIGDRGAQHHRVAVARENRAVRLARDAAGLERELAPSPHDLFADDIKHSFLFLPMQIRPSSPYGMRTPAAPNPPGWRIPQLGP